MTEILGWGSSFILLATLMRQVYAQWQSGATAGLCKWLFIGQVAASLGYVAYSVLLHNWIYVTSNAAILVTAIVGEAVYLRNRRKTARPLPSPLPIHTSSSPEGVG
jgi:MtN3 and saliva related transmembrane protein